MIILKHWFLRHLPLRKTNAFVHEVFPDLCLVLEAIAVVHLFIYKDSQDKQGASC